jgi:hypothetical protein
MFDLGITLNIGRSGKSAGGGAGVNEMIATQVLATNAATTASATSPPASSHAYIMYIEVTTPFSAAGTMSVGQTGSASLLCSAGDFDMTVSGAFYVKHLDVALSSLPILCTTNTPAAGAATVVVESAVPLT